MEEEIEEKLNNIYSEEIDIKFLSYGIYEAFLRICGKPISIIFNLDFKMTTEANIRNICYKIDKEILSLFKLSY